MSYFGCPLHFLSFSSFSVWLADLHLEPSPESALHSISTPAISFACRTFPPQVHVEGSFWFSPLLSYTLLLGGSFWIGCLIAFTPLLTTCSGFHVTVVTSPSQQYTCSTSLSTVHFCWHTLALQSCPSQLWCPLRIKSENLKHSLHVMNQSVSCAFRAILVMYLPWENWECSHSDHFFEGFSPRAPLRRLL